jgi:hypothetical protein
MSIKSFFLILFVPHHPSLIKYYKDRKERKLLDFDPHIYDGGGATFHNKNKDFIALKCY